MPDLVLQRIELNIELWNDEQFYRRGVICGQPGDGDYHHMVA